MTPVLKLDDFDYELPRRLIAQRPHSPRDGSRLMVLRRKTGAWEHARFADLPDLVSERDLLVLNDSRVLPARLAAVRKTGGRIEVLLLDALEDQVWRALLKPGRRARAGDLLTVHPELLSIRVLDDPGPAVRQVRLDAAGNLQEVLEQVGRPPLPPYIRREVDSPGPRGLSDRVRRQPGLGGGPDGGTPLHRGAPLSAELLQDHVARGLRDVPARGGGSSRGPPDALGVLRGLGRIRRGGFGATAGRGAASSRWEPRRPGSWSRSACATATWWRIGDGPISSSSPASNSRASTASSPIFTSPGHHCCSWCRRLPESACCGRATGRPSIAAIASTGYGDAMLIV